VFSSSSSSFVVQVAQFLERFVDLAHELGLPQKSSAAASRENTPILVPIDTSSSILPPEASLEASLPGELLLGEAALAGAETSEVSEGNDEEARGEAGWKANGKMANFGE